MSLGDTRMESVALAEPSLGRLDRLARDGVRRLLARLDDGELTVVEGRARDTFGRPATGAERLHATLHVRDPRFWSAVALGGALGAAESWVRGEWDCDDLTTLVRVLARHRALLAGLESGGARLQAPVLKALHALRRNTRGGSRRNIAAHYDLGNDFFETFLDPTMMYSCAIWPRPDATLEEASRHKLDVVCQSLGLAPGMDVLEIGTGWGGFAVHAASRYGCRVTTTTISRAQSEGALARVRAHGLGDRVTLLQEDYRDLPARLGRRFDRVVSIEMIEAVGHEYLPAFFRTIDALLEPAGRALIQAITIRDQDYDAYRRGTDFIRRWIFPGGCLPSVARMTDVVARHTPLRVVGLVDWTPHYARTLAEWRERFVAHRERLHAMGRDDMFQRLWLWYFGYCEAGFLERTIGLVHLALAGPRAGAGADGVASRPATEGA